MRHTPGMAQPCTGGAESALCYLILVDKSPTHRPAWEPCYKNQCKPLQITEAVRHHKPQRISLGQLLGGQHAML